MFPIMSCDYTPVGDGHWPQQNVNSLTYHSLWIFHSAKTPLQERSNYIVEFGFRVPFIRDALDCGRVLRIMR